MVFDEMLGTLWTESPPWVRYYLLPFLGIALVVLIIKWYES